MKIRILIVVTVIMSLLSSCKSKRDIVTSTEKIRVISESRLFKNIDENSLEFNNLWIKKFDCKVTLDSDSYSFKGSAFIQKDSSIVISVTPLLGIEMFRVQLSKDEIVLIDRTKKQLTYSTYKYLADKFYLDADYSSLEGMFSNSMFCYPNEGNGNECFRKFKKSQTDDMYVLQSYKERRINRMVRREGTSNLIMQEFRILPGIFKVASFNIKDLSDGNVLSVQYKDFRKMDNFVFPTVFEVKGYQGTRQFSLVLQILQVEKDVQDGIGFKIPEKYKRVDYR
jgi:hypothetical protein